MGQTPYEELLSRQTPTEPEFSEALAKNRSSLYTDLSNAPAPDELEVVGYLFDLRYGPDHWSQQRMFSNQLPNNPGDVRNVEPLVRRSQAHSTIAALRVERDEAQEAFKHLIVAMAQERLGVGDKEGGGLLIRNNRAETAEAEVKRLTEDNEALRAALKPFARVADMEHRAEEGSSVSVSISRCRDARSTLNRREKGE